MLPGAQERRVGADSCQREQDPQPPPFATATTLLPLLCTALALLDEGGLANVEELDLGSSAISDAGMRELAAAVARGGLPKCTDLRLSNNPGSGAPVQEALARRKSS